MSEQKALHVYAFDYDWFVATSEDDAEALYRKHYVHDVSAIDDAECDAQLADGCALVPDDETMQVWWNLKTNTVGDGGDTLIEKPAGELARINGRGYFCGTEW